MHPTFTLYIQKVFGHLMVLWIRSWVHPYTVTPVKVGPRYRKIGVRLSGNDAMMSLLRLFSTAVCILLSQLYMYKVFEHLRCCG
jgi:hypothetical protein